MIGGIVGVIIGIMTLIGYRHTNSPILFRLSTAFFSISIGFFTIWIGYTLEDFVFKAGSINRGIEVVGVAFQTIGYFFLAFSHTIKSFFPKARQFRTIVVMPLFIALIHVEHLLRSIAFILLIYAAIETIMTYATAQKKDTLIIAIGLSLLATGEFLGWYSVVFPKSVLYYISIMIQIFGLICIFIPIGRITFTRSKFTPSDI